MSAFSVLAVRYDAHTMFVCMIMRERGKERKREKRRETEKLKQHEKRATGGKATESESNEREG